MSLTIELYQCNKKPNSTAVPTNNPGDPFHIVSGVLLDGTSITNPVVTIEQNSTYDIRDYNYAKISVFNRYYFITNITTDKNLWILTMAVDVLATYKDDIRSSSQYVLRSASESDDNIVDKMYLTKPYSDNAGQRTGVTFYNSGYVERDLSNSTGQVFYFNYDGRMPINSVCFGIVGKNGVGVDYFVATEDKFIAFMTNVFALIPSDMGTMADGLKKLLLDLSQYIVSVIRLPVMPHTDNLGTHQTSVNLGSYTVTCDCYSVNPNLHCETYRLLNDLTLPQHPRISTHAYYAMPPFSSYVLDCLPLGSVPLDAAKLYGRTGINVEWTIDYVSGLAYYKVGYISGSYGYKVLPIFTDIVQVGIPIPLSQLKVDNLTGFGLSMVSGITNGTAFDSKETDVNANSFKSYDVGKNKISFPWSDIGGVLGRAIRADVTGTSMNDISNMKSLDHAIGNFIGINKDMVNKALDYTASLLGDVYTKGSTGSYLNILCGRPSVRAFFVDQADNDNTRYGSPLYAVRTLSTLSGFCLCQNATIEVATTKHPLPVEIDGIINMLNSGIYLE